MRATTQLGALGQRRLGEIAMCHSLIGLDGAEWLSTPEPERWDVDHERGIMYHGRPAVQGIDWGSEAGTAYVHSVDPDPRTFRSVDSGRHVSKLADAKQPEPLSLVAKAKRLVFIMATRRGEALGRALAHDLQYRMPVEMALDEAVARGILTREGADAFKGYTSVVVSGSDGSEET
jgi:hypothetical protein